RNQVVAAITRLDVDLVAEVAEVDHALQENQLHVIAPYSLAAGECRNACCPNRTDRYRTGDRGVRHGRPDTIPAPPSPRGEEGHASRAGGGVLTRCGCRCTGSARGSVHA